MNENDWRPIPDPTILTTEALLREISTLKTLIEQHINDNEELFDTKLQLARENSAALKELIEAKLEASQKAVTTANVANEKRFESVNEFRAQLNDMIRVLLPRSEADAKLAALDARTADNKDAIAILVAQLAGNTGTDAGVQQSRNDLRANIAIGISVGMGLLTMVTMIIVNAIHIAGH